MVIKKRKSFILSSGKKRQEKDQPFSLLNKVKKPIRLLLESLNTLPSALPDLQLVLSNTYRMRPVPPCKYSRVRKSGRELDSPLLCSMSKLNKENMACALAKIRLAARSFDSSPGLWMDSPSLK